MSKINPAPADALTPLMLAERVATAQKEVMAALAHLSYQEQMVTLSMTKQCLELHDALRGRNVFQSVIPMGALPPDLQELLTSGGLGGLVSGKPRSDERPPKGLGQKDLDEIFENE